MHLNLVFSFQVVYVARNPKDVIVSYFYHHRLYTAMEFKGQFEQFAEYFMNDDCEINQLIK